MPDYGRNNTCGVEINHLTITPHPLLQFLQFLEIVFSRGWRIDLGIGVRLRCVLTHSWGDCCQRQISLICVTGFAPRCCDMLSKFKSQELKQSWIFLVKNGLCETDIKIVINDCLAQQTTFDLDPRQKFPTRKDAFPALPTIVNIHTSAVQNI